MANFGERVRVPSELADRIPFIYWGLIALHQASDGKVPWFHVSSKFGKEKRIRLSALTDDALHRLNLLVNFHKKSRSTVFATALYLTTIPPRLPYFPKGLKKDQEEKE